MLYLSVRLILCNDDLETRKRGIIWNKKEQ